MRWDEGDVGYPGCFSPQCTYGHMHTHLLRQLLSEWQVMGQVLSRCIVFVREGGSGKREGSCGKMIYEFECDVSRHAE